MACEAWGVKTILIIFTIKNTTVTMIKAWTAISVIQPILKERNNYVL